MGSFVVVKFCSLRGDGRRGCEGWFKNGVKTYVTIDYIEFSFCWNTIYFNLQLIWFIHLKVDVRIPAGLDII